LEIVVKENISELSRYAAEQFVGLANEYIKQSGRFSVALSGGSTPKGLYKLLAAEEFRNRIDWTGVYFFFSDERCVPPDSVDSNYRMASESLLTPLEISDANIFRWRSEETPEKAASSYEWELKSFFKSDLPEIDLILLGMGPDGHTASLFPHSPALHEFVRIAVSNRVEKLKADRLTFTYPLVNNAANVVFLVAGGDKAEVLDQVIRRAKPFDELPSGGVLPLHGNLTWAVDAAAASLLNKDQI
jgi:6-phosphogluconolactonase